MDRTWVGTVKPMKWFDIYFDFFTQKHSKYFLTVFEELMSSTTSFDALPYTQSVVRKMTPELLAPVENEFVNFCAQIAISYPRESIELLFLKLRELMNANLIKNSNNLDLAKKILLIDKYNQENNTEKRKEIKEAVYYIIYPDER